MRTQKEEVIQKRKEGRNEGRERKEGRKLDVHMWSGSGRLDVSIYIRNREVLTAAKTAPGVSHPPQAWMKVVRGLEFAEGVSMRK
jgi:hypothetical protein